jgi:hypothetical protein
VSRYSQLISEIFSSKYKKGAKKVTFSRDDLIKASEKLGIKVPKNVGDIVYSFRYRTELPEEITSKATKGRDWIIRGEGDAKYSFCQVNVSKLSPQEDFNSINIPDNTPSIIKAFSSEDEQYALTCIRYNRLIDLLLGMNCYSLQNHLRTKVTGIGQIEIDEIYLGVDKFGNRYIIPVQAKGGNDKIGFVQTEQDTIFCEERYPDLICRPISVFRINDNQLALLELNITGDDLEIVSEVHYTLVKE